MVYVICRKLKLNHFMSLNLEDDGMASLQELGQYQINMFWKTKMLICYH